MENLQKQREKMEAHKQALIKKVLDVVKAETKTDALDILYHSDNILRLKKNK